MEVLLADEYGFCFGVERAVEMVEEVVEEGVRPIRSLGPLIHNAQEMERLDDRFTRRSRRGHDRRDSRAWRHTTGAART
jgi:4-hydroxy-3-methylbut-2-enyl diphosphate reductase